MATLDEIRHDITQLDQELLALLAKRKTLSIEVARAKQANPRPIRDHQREQDLLVALIQYRVSGRSHFSGTHFF